ncbi:hypothetical protein [Paraburkholderia aspalathi]|uniref:hypothetical protein n=1 Tax=Paraburkholderia aspalathi TaxID=1324617 RepID=UPI003CC49F5D
MIGAATLDHLRHSAHKINLDGESYRSLKTGNETLKTPLAKAGQNQATLLLVRTLEFTVSSGAITAKTPGANTPKGDIRKPMASDNNIRQQHLCQMFSFYVQSAYDRAAEPTGPAHSLRQAFTQRPRYIPWSADEVFNRF